MKKKVTTMLLMLLGLGIFAQAQNKPRGPREGGSTEERVKTSLDRLSSLNLSADQKTKLEKTYTDFFESMNASRSNSSGREAMQSIMEKRDKEVKEILTDDQYKKYKEQMGKNKPRGENKKRRNGEFK